MERKGNVIMLQMKMAEELKQIKGRMLKEPPDIIYGNAYQIDTKQAICGILMDMSQKMREDELRVLLSVSDLLAFLYSEWVQSKYEDPAAEVIRKSLKSSVMNLMVLNGTVENETTEKVSGYTIKEGAAKR
ncbi:MAG: DUF3848 domain-containing protein [Lachnospiraceae bacterium]|nr:DUF3848 domain-containing protein [Lachnospiraceae bacterium]